MNRKIASVKVGVDKNGNPIYKYYDLGTKNKSFLTVARTLQKLKIKTWYFMLELNDVSLANLNPYAVDKNTGKPSLTKDQISRIVTECMRNPWYYLREICRIPDQGGTSVPYLANRGNIAQAWCFFRGLDSWLCICRQKGKTQSALAAEAWAYSFGTTNSQFIFVNKDNENAKKNLSRLGDQIRLLPQYLQFNEYYDKSIGKVVRAIDNATMIKHPITNNEIVVKPKANSYESALSLARGLTAPIIHFDEPEFTNHIKTIVSNSVSTYEQAAANAKKNGAMYGRIFTCTPGDLATSMGQEAQSILDGTVQFNEHMYDWTNEQIEEYMRITKGDKCNKILYIEFMWNQIGLTKEWLKDMRAKINDDLTFRREILLQRLQGSSNSPYAQEDIEYIVSMMHQPIDELWLLDYYKFDIYKELDPKIPYILGVDCSTGTLGDNNAITIIDPYTVEPVAEFECSYIGETNYCRLLIELVTNHIPKAVLAIERNSVGDAIIDFLLNSPIRNNLYYDRNKDFREEKMRQNEESSLSMLRKEAASKSFYGVWTGSNGKGTGSRDDMFAILSNHVSQYKEKFICKNIIRDLTRLVKTPSGAIKAGTGRDENGEHFHDDSIMSYLIALYVYYHGNNLELFGITKYKLDPEQLNKGLKYADDIDPTLVDPSLIKSVKIQEEYENADNYGEILKEAWMRSQKDTIRLQNRGLITDSMYSRTPEMIMRDIESEVNISLDIFNTLNGF